MKKMGTGLARLISSVSYNANRIECNIHNNLIAEYTEIIEEL